MSQVNSEKFHAGRTEPVGNRRFGSLVNVEC